MRMFFCSATLRRIRIALSISVRVVERMVMRADDGESIAGMTSEFVTSAEPVVDLVDRVGYVRVHQVPIAISVLVERRSSLYATLTPCCLSGKKLLEAPLRKFQHDLYIKHLCSRVGFSLVNDRDDVSADC